MVNENITMIEENGKTYRVITGENYTIKELFEELEIIQSPSENNKIITLEELNSKIDDLTLLVLAQQGVIEL